MLGCCLRPRGDEKSVPILDVEKVLQDHVWKLFVESQPKILRTCLCRDSFTVDVPMNFFLFETIRQSVTPRARPEMGKDGHVFLQNDNHMKESNFGPVRKKNEKKQPEVDSNTLVIATDFVNDTGLEQTYKFRLEKTRKAALNVTFQKGFTIGGKANFTLGLPKIASDSKAEFGTDMSVNISKEKGEVIEETVVLETTSDVRVEKKSKYVAKVVLVERQVAYDFKVYSRMSMPMGSALASVVRKKDGKIFFTTVIKNLKTVFENYEKQVTILTNAGQSETNDYVIEFKTVGVLEGVRLSDQRIILEAAELHKPPALQCRIEEKPAPERTTINVDYVPLQPTIYPFSCERSGSLSTPVIEELDEEEEESNKDSASVFSRTHGGHRGPTSIGVIPCIVTTSPSSVCSSPLSEKEASDASDASKSTTV
ncbi:uncharacterized protein LOC131956853 [Physella acuta]|uniref:uncharacterized protein LOC131956853 n=1 Tax=Physella acuta TaxID=109671 RepID=UPI0027DE9523|nr:uncharacterized protein LOC131956853 [Physella acuta]